MAYALPKKKAPQKVTGTRPTPKAEMKMMPRKMMMQGMMSNHDTPGPAKPKKTTMRMK